MSYTISPSAFAHRFPRRPKKIRAHRRDAAQRTRGEKPRFALVLIFAFLCDLLCVLCARVARPRSRELKRGRLERATIVGPHQSFRDVISNPCAHSEIRVLHTQGIDDVGSDVVRERCCLHSLEHVADDGDAGVRVLDASSRLVDEPRSIQAVDGRGQGWFRTARRATFDSREPDVFRSRAQASRHSA